MFSSFLDAFIAVEVDATVSQGFLCVPCGVAFNNKIELEEHFNLKHKAVITRTEIEMKDQSNIKKKDSSRFGCPLCPRSFTQKVNMQRHVRDKHSETHLSYKCPKCGAVLSNSNSFTSHVHKQHPELKHEYDLRYENLKQFSFDNRQNKDM